MSSSITPPPTGGGNAKYVAVVVLLLGGIGALVYFRSRGDTEPQKPIVLVADASTPINNHRIDDDYVPPPTPIPEAGPDVAQVKVAFTGTVGNPCTAAKCSGAATPELEGALAFRAKQAHRCYDAALAQDPTLKGRISVSVRVAGNGQVCSANVGMNELSGSTVAQCVANMFRQSGHFPTPTGGCVDATVPISFVPGGH